MAVNFLDIRQSIYRPTPVMVGNVGGAGVDTLLGSIDSEVQKLFEDRNVIMTDGGVISLSADGVTLSFSRALKLILPSTATGGPATVLTLPSTNVTFTSNGYLWYATVDRTTPAVSTNVVSGSVGLPATTFTNQEIFLLAVRVDSADLTKGVYLRGGTMVFAGQSVRIGSPSVLDTSFSIGHGGNNVGTGLDPSTQFLFSLASATPGTTLTLASQTTTDQTFLFPNLASTPQYTFTVTSANATTGAVYSNNGQAFTVNSTITAGTTLTAFGTGNPLASGTLTKVSGTGDATITFSSFSVTNISSSTIVTTQSTQTLLNTTLAFLQTSILTDPTVYGADATLQAADITVGQVALTGVTGTSSIAAIPAGANGQVLTLVNQTANTIEIINNFGGANKPISTGAGAGFIDMPGGSSITFTYSTTYGAWVITGGVPVSINAFGSVPNAEGVSIVNGGLTLQPASASFPGGITTGTQTFAGNKTILGTLTLDDGGSSVIDSQSVGLVFNAPGDVIFPSITNNAGLASGLAGRLDLLYNESVPTLHSLLAANNQVSQPQFIARGTFQVNFTGAQLDSVTILANEGFSSSVSLIVYPSVPEEDQSFTLTFDPVFSSGSPTVVYSITNQGNEGYNAVAINLQSQITTSTLQFTTNGAPTATTTSIVVHVMAIGYI